jgi:signal transduction histidine kinase
MQPFSEFVPDGWSGVDQFLRTGGLDELRRPLWTMLAAVNALQRSDQLGAWERRLVDKIDASLERTLEVVRDLVDGRALDEGRAMPLLLRATDVASLASRVAAATREDRPDHELWCAFGVSGSAEWDAARVEQMLSSIAEHALEASDADSPVLLSGRDVADDWVEFEAEFHDSSQQPPTTSDSLPLAIAFHIARGHEGHAEVRRGGDGATRIVVRLPRHGGARDRIRPSTDTVTLGERSP